MFISTVSTCIERFCTSKYPLKSQYISAVIKVNKRDVLSFGTDLTRLLAGGISRCASLGRIKHPTYARYYLIGDYNIPDAVANCAISSLASSFELAVDCGQGCGHGSRGHELGHHIEERTLPSPNHGRVLSFDPSWSPTVQR